MAIVNKFNVNKQEVTLDADIIENMSANDVSYNDSTQYDENTVGDKLSKLESDTKEYLYNSTGLRGNSYIDSEDNAKWKQLVNNLSIKAGQKFRIVFNFSMNQWSRFILAYNNNSNNRLKDNDVYRSSIIVEFDAPEDISSFEIFVNVTSDLKINWLLYVDVVIQDLKEEENIKAKLYANGILSTSATGNHNLQSIVKTDIKKGQRWKFKVESTNKIWTRLLLIANNNNSLRILDSSDTSIEGKWLSNVAKYYISEIGFYVIAPTEDTYTLTYNSEDTEMDDKEVTFEEIVKNIFTPIIHLQRNLLNPYTIVNGYLKNTGEIIAYDGIVTSDYIPVPKGTTLFVEKFVKFGIFNKSKEIQSNFLDSDVSNYFFEATDDCFVRISIRGDAYKMVAYSTSVIPYESYRATIEQGVTFSDAQISQVKSLLSKANGDRLILQKNGNVYKFSSNGISMTCEIDEGRNGVFNFSSVSCYGDEITQGDDVAPIHAIDTTIGANHAHPCWMATINEHGKTSSNIGETWVDASNKSFCLVAVTDVNNIIFIGVNLNETLSTGAITHDGETMTISSVSSTQMYPSVKNLSHRVFQNGSNEIIEDEDFTCQYVDVVEQYDIMLTSSTITKLLTGGKIYDGDAFVRIINTYRIMENCNTLVFVSLIPLMSFSFSDAMFSQAIRQGNNGSVAYYLPNSKPASHNFTKPLKLTFSDALSGLYIGSSYWKDTNNPINRVVQIGANHGFAIGFIPIGVGENLEQYTDNTFEIRNNTGKIYLHGVESSKVGSTLQVGNVYSAGIYRCYFPLNGLGDKVSLYHYNLNGVEYVYADFSHEGVENLVIGTDYNGKKVEVVESSNVNLITSMYNNGVMVNVDYTDNDTSYIVLKFVE